MNRIEALTKEGQSVWLDYIRRSLLTTGELRGLVEQGVRGVTSNPTIFEKAIGGSSDYDSWLEGYLLEEPHTDAETLFEKLAVHDIQGACDVLRPVWNESKGADGHVSLEVSPKLALDADGTVGEARKLWKLVGRPNLMIKVPATVQCLPAIETLIADGINVNVTLIFSVARYEEVVKRYIAGVVRSADPKHIASVASFFVSRIDSAIDPMLDKLGTPEAKALRGKAAIANARIAYQRFRELFAGAEWEKQAARGAMVQRPLWASTSVKDPAYRDVMYAEELVGPHTVDTMPPATYAAFLDHGVARASLLESSDDAAVFAGLAKVGVSMDAITKKVEDEGLASFEKSFDGMLKVLREKRHTILEKHTDKQTLSLGAASAAVDACLAGWDKAGMLKRLWAKDPTVWRPTNEPELADRLGWLHLHELMERHEEELRSFAKEVAAEGCKHVVLLGMGGSSLAPEVFQSTFGNAPGHPELLVLDSTHPDAFEAIAKRVDVERTLFLVSSKSGGTTESNSFFLLFWERAQKLGAARGRRFVAITDPGTSLEKLAKERGFRRVFSTPPDVGGRYSALTYFGLVPAALIGVDPDGLLDRAWTMAESNAYFLDASKAPAIRLGAAMGELAKAGRDKVTFFCSPKLAAFPAWVEQLIAESTGKDDKGIVPIADEAPGAPEVYGNDRFFVSLELAGDGDGAIEAALGKLEAAGHPVARIRLSNAKDIAQEMLRFELATAAAGAALAIHPFNQPNVQLAKTLAADAMAGKLDLSEAEKATVSVSDAAALAAACKTFRESLRAGDYVGLHAYLKPGDALWKGLQAMRHGVRDRHRVATTLGWGPRFLHSTGQLHKGDGNRGAFIQLVDEPSAPVPVPETSYTLASLVRAQALGDWQALRQRGRRVLRVHLGKDVDAGLRSLSAALLA